MPQKAKGQASGQGLFPGDPGYVPTSTPQFKFTPGGSQPGATDVINPPTSSPGGFDGIDLAAPTISGVAHSFEDFREQFARSEQERQAKAQAIRAGFQPLIQEAQDFGRARQGVAAAAGARAGGGLGYDSAQESTVQSIQKETAKRLTSIEAAIQQAVLQEDAEAEKRAREDFTAWKDLQDQAFQQQRQIFQDKLSILGERRAQGEQEARFTGYYNGQETLDMQRFQSDDAYRQEQTQLAKDQFQLDVDRFGVDTALNIAQQNGVMAEMDPTTGEVNITDIKTPEAQLTEARTSEILQLLPLQIQKLQKEIANIGNKSGASGTKFSEYVEALQAVEALPVGAPAGPLQTDDPDQVTEEERAALIERIKSQMIDDFGTSKDVLGKIDEIMGGAAPTGKFVTTPSGVFDVDRGRYLTPQEAEGLKGSRESISGGSGTITFGRSD